MHICHLKLSWVQAQLITVDESDGYPARLIQHLQVLYKNNGTGIQRLASLTAHRERTSSSENHRSR